jgi:hypothetical protein
MSRARFALALLVMFGAVALDADLAAEEPESTVVVVVETGESSLVQRLGQEIESMGLRVLWGGPGLPPGRSLEAEARAAGAVAAIRVTSVGGGVVEMTILDRVTGKTVHRELAVSTPADPAAAELIATRTVELLRASLMELASPHPPRGEVPVTAKVRALAPPAPVTALPAEPRRPGILSVAAGPAVLLSPKWRAGGDLMVGVTWMAMSRFGVEGSVLVPLLPARLSSQEGHAELAATVGRVGGVARWGGRSSAVAVRTAAGVALGSLGFSGAARSPYVGVHDRLWSWSPYLGSGLGWRVAPSFGLRADVAVGVDASHTVVRFAGREVADWGRPWLEGSAALELSWP